MRHIFKNCLFSPYVSKLKVLEDKVKSDMFSNFGYFHLIFQYEVLVLAVFTLYKFGD